MEYLAKITQEQKTTNKNVWRYTFLDIQTNQEDWFLNNYRVNYIPNLAGSLNLIESDKNPKFFQSFEQDVANVDKELLQAETAIQLQRGLEKDIKKAESRFAKKKVKLTERSEHLTSLRLRKIFSQKQLALAYNKSTRTIRRWEKPKLTFQRTGRKQKICVYDLLLLMSHVFTQPIAIQQDRSDYIFEKTGRWYSQQIISLILKRIGFPRKVVPYRYSKQKELMAQYWKFITEIVPNLPPHLLLSLDESGFSLKLALRYGYAPIGKRVKAYKPGWGTNYSLTSLIHNIEKEGIIHCELIKGAVDIEVFYNFLVNVKLPTNEKYYLLMDNLRVHKNEKIEELLKQKNIEPIYLVSYFPQLNPIEEVFNVIKQYVKKMKPRTEEDLMSVLAEKIAILQEEDMTKYFRDCLSFKID